MTRPYKLNMRKATLARFKDDTFTVKLVFPFSPEDVEIVKRIPGRKWWPESRVWTCHPTKQALKILDDAKFVVSKNLRKHIYRRDFLVNDLEIPGLKKTLFPYQSQGVGFINHKNGRALVGDDMGLGKTVQALGWLQLHPEIRPAVIVAPASVKLNWAKEITAWMSETTVEILKGRTPYAIDAEIIIINYDILDAWLPALIAMNPQAIIADEIQTVKSGKAKRTKALRKLSRHVKHFIGLSGTPIVNRPVEFYYPIQMIDPKLFPNWIDFTAKYCGRKHNGFGWDVNGSSNTEELHEILEQSIMIRRTKAQVLTDLPDKLRSFVPIELSADMDAEYIEAENNFLHWMETRRGKDAADRASNAQALAEIEVLKQVAVEAKLPQCVDWIKDVISTGEKLVVFATHKFVIDALMQEFGNVAVKIDGSVSSTQRQRAVDAFQGRREVGIKRIVTKVEIEYIDIPLKEQPILFIGNIKAAGVGITLTAASNVAFLELPWTPGDLAQAEDRCHRIGQKDTVNIYYLLAEHTIEERIAELLDRKRRVLDSVLDGKDTADESLLMELIQNY